MKTIKKIAVSALAIFTVLTFVMSTSVKSTHAVGPECKCISTGVPADGKWVSTTDGTTPGGRLCEDAGYAGKSCNTLTSTFVQSPIKVPKFGDFLANIIRIFFLIASIVALLYLLMGAFKWITSSGKEEGVKEAREQIQAALLGLVVMVAVLALVVVIEQVIFGGKICLGISCPLELPQLSPQ